MLYIFTLRVCPFFFLYFSEQVTAFNWFNGHLTTKAKTVTVNLLCRVLSLDELFTSCFCLLPRSQDSTFTPTPPWQQSLGLVTSSAEQEAGCSTQDSGDEDSRQADKFNTPHPAHRGCLEDHKGTEEMVLSPLLSLERSSYNSPPFAKYSHLSIEKPVGNTPILNSCFSLSTPGPNIKAKWFSTEQLTETLLPCSVAWEDLPFSESLTEFLCEENKDFDIVSETEPHENVQNQKEMLKNNPEIRSQDKNLSIQSTSVSQSKTQKADSHSRVLLDVTNKPALNGGDRHDLSDQVCKNPVKSLNKSQAKNICSQERNREDGKASLLSFESEEEEQFEGDAYNCSADLFSSSLTSDVITNTLNTHAETARDTCPVLSKQDKQHLRSEKANTPHSTTDKQELNSKKCINRDSLITPATEDLDFIPPSQSTPIVKAAVVSGSPASSYRSLTLSEFSLQPDSQDSSACHRILPELVSYRPAKVTSSLCKSNCVSANQRCQCAKESTEENRMWSTTSYRHRFTPKRRFWKPENNKKHLLAQQHLRVQRGALNTGSPGRIKHKCDTCNCDMTVCDYEDSKEIIVPPTPAAKTQESVKRRIRRQTDSSSTKFGNTWEEQQGDGANCKRTVLDQTLASSQRDHTQTGNCDSETVIEGSQDGSTSCLLDDENEACEWSRDLFSDSV